MTLPNFLVIGAMKAGTTTLYEELQRVPGVWLPPEKEPSDLADIKVVQPKWLAKYEWKFSKAGGCSFIGDASTAYAKRPTYDGVAERARQILGEEVKIIYIIRDPIRRIVSQYQHLWGLQMEHRALNRAVLEDDTYVDYSRYSWQLEPWYAAFNKDQIIVIRFEDLINNAEHSLRDICLFLGLQQSPKPLGVHRNASSGALVPIEGTMSQKLATSKIYLYGIKPYLPQVLRDTMRKVLLPTARPMNETLSLETRNELISRLMGDQLASQYLQTAD